MYPLKRFQNWLLLILVVLSTQSCFAEVADSGITSEVTVIGVLKKQGITVYMYGDYVLVDRNGKTVYALRQGKTDLDAYVGRTVTIKGRPIKGYPVDFGPPYIEVETISLDTKEK
jgi:hypothetical protein